jgi:hypothetical protein
MYYTGLQQAVEVPDGSYTYQTIFGKVVGVLRNEFNTPALNNATQSAPGNATAGSGGSINPNTTLLSCGITTPTQLTQMIRAIQSELGLPNVTFEFPDLAQITGETDVPNAYTGKFGANPIYALVTIDDAVKYILNFL